MKKIILGADHGGYELKNHIKAHLEARGFDVVDVGTNSAESCDYPVFASYLCQKIQNGEAELGILVCGTGIGISIACNKVKGIRCAKVDSIEDVIATRNDNDSNIIAFGEKMPVEKALELVKTFVTTPASEEEKHKRKDGKRNYRTA